MAEEPRTEPGATVPAQDAAPSTELVVPDRRPPALPVRRWPDAVARARGRLLQLRENPAAMVSLSAAATVGSALLTTGLRRALQQTAVSPAGRTASVAGRTASVSVRGYVVHEIHVIHHVVHHVVRPPES